MLTACCLACVTYATPQIVLNIPVLLRSAPCLQAGVAAIAHPGGSIRDTDAVDCCNKYGVAIVTTGVRHFKH